MSEPDRMRPELRKVFEASWERNEAAYRYLSRGDGDDLSLDEAAAFLHVSPAWVLARVAAGELPCRGQGRFAAADVAAFKAAIDARRDEALTELVRLSEEMGLYD